MIQRVRPDLVRALSGRSAVSWWAFGLISVLSISRGTVRAIVTGTDPIADHLKIGIGSAVATGIIMALAWVLIYRHPSQHPSRRVVITLILYMVIAIAHLGVAVAIAGKLGISLPITLPRIAGAVIALTIIAYAVDQFDSYHSNSRRLRAQQQELRSVLASNATALTAGRTEVAELIKARIDLPIQEVSTRLKSQLTSNVTDLATVRGVANELSDLGTQLVRPLSHEIDDLSQQSLTTSTSQAAPKNTPNERWLRARDVATWAVINRAFRPVLVGLSVTVGFLAGGYALRAPVLLALITGGLMMLGLWLAAKVLTPVMAAWSFRTRTATTLAVYAVLGVLTACAITLVAAPEQDMYAAWVLSALGSIIVCGLWALIGAVTDRARSSIADLESTNAVIRWEVGEVEVQHQRVRRQLAALLHSDIQSRLMIAAATIDHSLNSGENTRIRESIEAAVHMLDDIESTIQQIAQGDDPVPVVVSLTSAIDAVAASWRGVADVDVNCDPDCESLIQAHPQRAASIVEMVREATANAVRHGNAKHIAVALVAKDQAIQMTIVDDGSGPANSSGAGLGTRQLHRLSSQWSRQAITGGGTELRILVPIGPDVFS